MGVLHFSLGEWPSFVQQIFKSVKPYCNIPHNINILRMANKTHVKRLATLRQLFGEALIPRMTLESVLGNPIGKGGKERILKFFD
jgi:hypothetical protein